MYGPDRVYSKSGMRGWAEKTGAEMYGVVTHCCGCRPKRTDAGGPLAVDASGFSQMTHADWGDAKKGIISRRKFDKLHILIAPHGMMVMCKAAPGRGPTTRLYSGRCLRLFQKAAAATSCWMRHTLPRRTAR